MKNFTRALCIHSETDLVIVGNYYDLENYVTSSWVWVYYIGGKVFALSPVSWFITVEIPIIGV